MRDRARPHHDDRPVGHAGGDELIAVRGPEVGEGPRPRAAREPSRDPPGVVTRRRGTASTTSSPTSKHPGPALGPMTATRSRGSEPNASCIAAIAATAIDGARAAPSRVHGGHRGPATVGHEDGHAVGHAHRQRGVRIVGHERVGLRRMLAARHRRVGAHDLHHPPVHLVDAREPRVVDAEHAGEQVRAMRRAGIGGPEVGVARREQVRRDVGERTADQRAADGRIDGIDARIEWMRSSRCASSHAPRRRGRCAGRLA